MRTCVMANRQKGKKWFRPALELLEDRLPPAMSPFVEPPVLASQNGVLTATLIEAQSPTMIGDVSVINPWTYNGSYVGPTLMANPGDLLDITIVNNLPDGQTTNLHTHGLHVSPVGDSDNILLQIAPGEEHHYQIQIPADHPQGLYWYHPHHHGEVFSQISMGLSGMLVIGRPDGGPSQLNGLPQHVLGLQNALLAGNQINVPVPFSDVNAQTFTVNGQLQPHLDLPVGQYQVFNIADIGNKAFYRLQVFDTGTNLPVPLLTVAADGNPYTQVRQSPFLDVSPGQRWSFVLAPPSAGANAVAGTYELRTLGYFDGVHAWPPRTLMTMNYVGNAISLPPAPVADGTPLTPPNQNYVDLRNLPVAAHRVVRFDNDGMGAQLINDAAFPDNPVFQPRLNTVEEWTVENPTTVDHPFHLHVNSQQVVLAPDQPTGLPYYQDVINVPAGQSVTIRIQFLDELGLTVYHCHRTDHEDHGMMAAVNVVPEAPFFAVAANAGQKPRIKVFNPVTGTLVTSFFAFPRSYRGGVNVAVADVNGDGVYDLVVAKTHGQSRIKVIDGTQLDQIDVATGIPSSALLGDFLTYSPAFHGGVYVAAGYVNGDNKADIIVGAGSGGPPRVKIIDATKLDQVGTNFVIIPNALLADFNAFGIDFRGGVRVAAADLDGNGRLEVITAKGPGSTPLVRVFDGVDLQILDSFLAYAHGFRGGVYVAAGNTSGTAFAKLITGAGANGTPKVNVYAVPTDHTAHASASGHEPAQQSDHPAASGGYLEKIDSFFAYKRADRDGVRVSSLHAPATSVPYGGSHDDIVTTPAIGDGTDFSIFHRNHHDS